MEIGFSRGQNFQYSWPLNVSCSTSRGGGGAALICNPQSSSSNLCRRFTSPIAVWNEALSPYYVVYKPRLEHSTVRRPFSEPSTGAAVSFPALGSDILWLCVPRSDFLYLYVPWERKKKTFIGGKAGSRLVGGNRINDGVRCGGSIIRRVLVLSWVFWVKEEFRVYRIRNREV